ncbi:GIY-YIG nuclease family protein [Roseibium aggregatum]|uniref:GIY-YIG nuclease family protein n=1 Tax=Roseibium aggregatum TaxID=187304 RepID=UPI001E4B2EE8|nr:GIY-YIG nuclease family protein [Roseibium aggregatum]UES46804.1 DUF4357 domain-containing protein [Roseibium aggregatum]
MVGKSVRIFLVDGTPTGLLTAEIMNWTGHALVLPRSRLVEALNREEAGRTGVYLLIGEDPENPSRQMIYVGEGDTVKTRIKSHATDDTKDFWTHACIFTSKDKNLTKAHVRYLEGRLIDLAETAERAKVANLKGASVSSFLPESDTSDMEYFLAQVEVILPVVGIDALRPKARRPLLGADLEGHAILPKSSEPLELELSSKKHGYWAAAVENDGELTVLDGSQALAHPTHARNDYAGLRQQLIDDGLLVQDQDNSNFLVFEAGVVFKSPSAAASVINGRNSNGRTEWIVKATGQTLKAYQDEALKSVVDDDDGSL